MSINRIIVIEDMPFKYNSVKLALQDMGFKSIVRMKDSVTGVDAIVNAVNEGNPFDLLICDMQFPLCEAENTMIHSAAGLKTMREIRTRGVDIPIIFCSSYKISVEGAIGSVFYNENNDWESELRRYISRVNG